MKFQPTSLPGVFVIDTEPISDDRGFFARTWCQDEFKRLGLAADFVQCSISYNRRRGTLRGMHYQKSPHEEVRLVRCTKGGIFDVALDLRPDSQTFKQWFGTELSDQNRKQMYIPKGCAHGFLTLSDDAEVFYQISEFHHPESAAGVRWDDPAFGIQWPAEVAVLHQRDATYPSF